MMNNFKIPHKTIHFIECPGYIWKKKYTMKKHFSSKLFLPISRTLEYANCNPCKGVRPPKKTECPGNYTKLHLMVRFQFWSFGGVEYSFIVITPKPTLTWSGNTC